MAAPSSILIEGPWQHREVAANGCRFHVAEAGTGPLVLLLPGFPQHWWMWRHQLVGLAEAGFRAVAVDLRGMGGSDRQPNGYDGYTLAADVAGLVRALGEQDAAIAGHDWGGVVACAVAALHPAVVRRLALLSIAHPVRFRTALLTDRHQLAASSYFAGFQVPGRAERNLVADDAAAVDQLLTRWAGPGFPDEESRRRYRDAMLSPGAAHCALEYYRWFVRSAVRPSGVRFMRALTQPVDQPTLQLHGAADPCVLPSTALGSGRFVQGPYEWRLVEGAGHFLPEERPELVTGELIRWAKA